MKTNKLLKTLTLLSLSLISVTCINTDTYAQDFVLPNNQLTSTTPIETEDSISTELLDNGDYIETVIVSETSLSNSALGISTLSTSKTITKTKTTYYKNSAGSVMWSVSIKATFTYNGSTSKCTSCSHSTTSPGKSWSIKSCSSSKSGNKATATAVATHTDSDGSKYNINRSVTISCNATGKVS